VSSQIVPYSKRSRMQAVVTHRTGDPEVPGLEGVERTAVHS